MQLLLARQSKVDGVGVLIANPVDGEVDTTLDYYFSMDHVELTERKKDRFCKVCLATNLVYFLSLLPRIHRT